MGGPKAKSNTAVHNNFNGLQGQLRRRPDLPDANGTTGES